jgi:hypothetical protein
MNFIIRRASFPALAVNLSVAAIAVTAACSARAQSISFAPSPSLEKSTPATDDPPGVAQALAVTAYSSRPGAPYTMYLDFGGFAFNGLWGGVASQNPGTTPAYSVDANTSSFSAAELANIKIIWSRTAEKYSPYNVNVTTVDPAAAAGQAANDAQRQFYYDTHGRMMHTVIGGSGGWTGGGGVSYGGVTQAAYSGAGSSNGFHTNWVFSGQAPSNLQFIGEAAAHEDGHGFGLHHQSDYSGSTLLNEYSSGTGTGAGSKAPIMGNSYSAERGLWKIGTSHVNSGGPSTQNDPNVILASNSGLPPFINDAVGHTLATATAVPMSGLSIDFNLAQGVIVPASSTPITTIGSANYVSDYWSFSTGSGPVSLSVMAGRESITPGAPDPGAMLDASLEILSTSGTVLFSAATSSLSQTLNVNLTAGNYVARVFSAGDPSGQNFYDMGSYFLKGTLSPVPEPSTMFSLLAASTIFAARWNRRRHET